MGIAVTKRLVIATALIVCQGAALAWAQVDLRNAPKNIRELIDKKERPVIAVRYAAVWKYFARDGYVAKLRPEELTRYKSAFDAAKCNVVNRLQTKGFFRTYPFLNRVHQRPAARQSFDRIVSWRVLDYVHCVYRNQVDMLLRLASQEQIGMEVVDLSTRDSGRRHEQLIDSSNLISSTLRARIHNSLCEAGSWFLIQAIRKQYTEGLRQLLIYMFDLKLIKLGPQQSYYLYALARSDAIVSKIKLLQLEPSYHSVSAKDRIVIDQYVESNGSATRLPAIYPRYCGRERLTAEFRLEPPF